MAVTPLRPPKAPNLLVAPVTYAQLYQDQLNNALRLYFNQIDNGLFSLLNPNGGGFLSFPHLAASDSTDQYAGGDNTPTAVAWDTVDSNSGFTLKAPGIAVTDVSGIYKFTYSAQLVNTDNAIHAATFWLKANKGLGFVDVSNSATVFSVPSRKSAMVPSYLCGYSEVTFAVDAGDEIELYWATEKAYSTTGPVDGVYIYADAAQTVPYARPAVPSVIGSITFMSRLPTTA